MNRNTKEDNKTKNFMPCLPPPLNSLDLYMVMNPIKINKAMISRISYTCNN